MQRQILDQGDFWEASETLEGLEIVRDNKDEYMCYAYMTPLRRAPTLPMTKR